MDSAAGIHVLVQYCNDSRPERQFEYDECVWRNLGNPQVAAVHNLIEPGTAVPDHIRLHPKYREHAVGGWLTFADAIAYANDRLAGELVCLCNLDIFLDPGSDWGRAAGLGAEGVVLCLSRHEFDGEGFFRDPHLLGVAFAHSQDAWVFTAPIAVEDCRFELGMMGCDNAFAHRLKRSGYTPLNAPGLYRIFHFDRARGKSGGNALSVHAAEPAKRVANRHPEERGSYLVPDIEATRSLDKLLDELQAPALYRYQLACDIFTHCLAVRNRRDGGE